MKFVEKMLNRAGLKRKGITPVIAIVLLLMMTVAAAGMAYVWIMSVQEGIAEDTDADINRLQDEKNTRLEIVSVYNTSPDGYLNFVVKNSGSHVFTAEESTNINIYIDGVMLTTESCSLTGQGSTCVIAPGAGDEIDYPTVPGSSGAVEIRVEPSFGTGDVHRCSIPTAGTHKTC